MTRTVLAKVFGISILVLVLGGCGSGGMTSMASGAFEQLGGMDGVRKLANSVLSSSMKDPRLSGLLGNVNTATASPKVADQMCSELGGGCKAPYTEQQIAAGADRLSPTQKSAASENLSSALNSVTSNPAVKDAVTKVLGPKMGGILASLV